MKTRLGIFSVIVITGLLVSCVTGDYMAMKSSENAAVLGIVQTTFNVTGSFRYRHTINRHAYISLMAEAQKQHPDIIVDVRDISWAIGQADTSNNNYEYSAIAKIIKK